MPLIFSFPYRKDSLTFPVRKIYCSSKEFFHAGVSGIFFTAVGRHGIQFFHFPTRTDDLLHDTVSVRTVQRACSRIVFLSRYDSVLRKRQRQDYDPECNRAEVEACKKCPVQSLRLFRSVCRILYRRFCGRRMRRHHRASFGKQVHCKR